MSKRTPAGAIIALRRDRAKFDMATQPTIVF